jgi:hypothetical protein
MDEFTDTVSARVQSSSSDAKDTELHICDTPGTGSGLPKLPSFTCVSPHNESSNAKSLPERPDVLWCLEVNQNGKPQRTFYQDKPWRGINNGLPDSDPDEDMDSRAVLTYTVRAEVIDITGKESNTSTTWKDRPVDFQFGRDAVLFTRMRPTIMIHSKRLIKVITTTLNYYPYRTNENLFAANLDDSFHELMYCYQELKLYLNSYLKMLSKEKRGHPKLNIGSCGDEKLIELMYPRLQLDVLHELANPCDEATAQDLAVLLRLLAGMYRTKVIPTLTSIYFDKNPAAAYNSIWMLFRPGTTVYVKQTALRVRPDPLENLDFAPLKRRPLKDADHEYAAYVVAAWKYVEPTLGIVGAQQDDSECLELTLWSIGWTGVAFQRIAHDAVIAKFDGSRQLRDLPVVPALIYDTFDKGALRDKLEKRGRKYVTLLDGLAAHRLYSHKNTGYNGPIIVDPEAYQQHIMDDQDPYRFPGALPLPYVAPIPSSIDDGGGGTRFEGLIDVLPSNIDTFDRSKELCLLLPRRTEGFALRTKKWMIFEVEGLNDKLPMRSHDQLDSELVLAPDTDRESLQTILPRGERSLTTASDFVEGKGEGTIFLLYGGPGTGKTLTVECVANDKCRPLIRITAQDLGLENRIESQLRTWFTLAAKWEAILLIDEADLFLEQRRAGDLQRNSLSTVFLRTMEYYQGVLFLTTNRPGHIDDSFISRITYPIYYPPLSADAKGRIVKKFVERFEETGNILIEKQAATYLIDHCQELNGRELRNVLQNAVEAAEAKLREIRPSTSNSSNTMRPFMLEVEVRHVKAAVERQAGFQAYLEELRKKSLVERARNKGDWK